MPRAFIHSVFLACVATTACGELSTNPGGDDGGTRRLPCHVCDGVSAMECELGECRFRCDAAPVDLCAGTGYCEASTCAADREPDCTELPCTPAQSCVADYCVVKTATACATVDDPACGEDALCDVTSRRCVQLPYCDRDYTCRPGDRGAACNVVSASRVHRHPRVSGSRCLLGFCSGDGDCPVDTTCQGIGATYESLGTCR